MQTRVIGVRHDGGGRYPLQSIYTQEPGALASAEAVDPAVYLF